MSAKSSAALSALALAAAAGALLAYSQTGVVPDAPAGGTCLLSVAYGPCEAARALSADAGEEDCSEGGVYRYVEQVVAETDGGEGGSLPPGFVAIPGSTVEVPCASLRRASKALTVRKPLPSLGACLVGPWVTDAGEWDGRPETSKCCGPECVCAGRCVSTPPVVLAGADDTLSLLCSVTDGGCP